MPSTTLSLLKVPAFPGAFLAILFAVLAQAMAGSYMTLNAVDRAGMSPLLLSVFLTSSAASAIVFNTWFGRRLDRTAELWPLFVALVTTVAGWIVVATSTNVVVLILAGVFLLGPSSASFTLLFGIAKGYLDGGGPTIVSSGMAAMRMNSSLGWAVGPALAALCVALGGFPGVYWGAAGFGLAALVVAVAGRVRPLAPHKPADAAAGVALWLQAAPAAISLTLFNTAMFMGSNAMVIVVPGQLGGAETDVGLLFSLCAAIEVVVMGVFVVRPAHRANRALIVAGFVCFAAYFALSLLLPTLATLYWGQILRAVAIGIVSVLGMMYVQDLMPGRPGSAAALFANTVSVSSLISGLATGLWAQFLGYMSIFGLCIALSLLGAGVVAIGRSR